MNKRLKKIVLGTSLKTAKELLKNPSDLNIKMEKAVDKLNKKTIKETFGKNWEDLKLLLRFVKQSSSRNYKNVSTQTIIYATVAIIYFLTPADFIPDVVVAAGYLDDIIVLKWVLKAIGKELEQFKQWEKTGNESPQEANLGNHSEEISEETGEEIEVIKESDDEKY